MARTAFTCVSRIFAGAASFRTCPLRSAARFWKRTPGEAKRCCLRPTLGVIGDVGRLEMAAIETGRLLRVRKIGGIPRAHGTVTGIAENLQAPEQPHGIAAGQRIASVPVAGG